MTHSEITRKLLGSIQPTGDSGRDKERLENLHNTIEVVHTLLEDIKMVARDINSYEHSVKLIATEADNYLKDLGI